MMELERTEFIAPKRIVRCSGDFPAGSLLCGEPGAFQTLWKPPRFVLPPGAGILLDFGEELQGGIRIVLGRCSPSGFRGERPYSVRLRFGESVSEAMNEPVNHHTMHDLTVPLAPMGESRYGRTGFRFLQLDSLEPLIPLNIMDISAVRLLPPVAPAGEFHSSDALLDEIFRCCRRTVDNCIAPLIVDGAKRDRLVWMGDLYGEIRALCAFYGDHPAIRPTMEFMLDEAGESGIFNRMQPYSPYFFLALESYLTWCGGREWVSGIGAPAAAVADRMLAEWERSPGELLERGMIDWGEKSESGLVPCGYPPLLAAGAAACRRIALLMGDDRLAQRCDGVWREIRRRYVPAGRSKSAGAWAAYAGLLPPEQVCREILDRMPDEGLSTFHLDTMLVVRSRAGDTGGASALLRRYLGGMISLGATTFWEQFDLDWLENAGRIDLPPEAGKVDVHRDCGRGCFAGWRHSLCHGWGAAPAAWMLEYLLGARPVAPGFAEAEISENIPSAPEELHGSCPTPFGAIEISRRAGRIVRLRVPEPIRYRVV